MLLMVSAALSAVKQRKEVISCSLGSHPGEWLPLFPQQEKKSGMQGKKSGMQKVVLFGKNGY